MAAPGWQEHLHFLGGQDKDRAQKWTCGDHTGIMASTQCCAIFMEASAISGEQLEALRSTLKPYAKAVDYVSGHVDALNGPATYSRDLILGMAFDCDQSIQMLADSNALFLQRGNCTADNIANLNDHISQRSVFIPMYAPNYSAITDYGIPLWKQLPQMFFPDCVSPGPLHRRSTLSKLNPRAQ